MTSHRTRVASGESQIFYGVLLLALAATFSRHHFVSWDGPAHVASATGLTSYRGAVADVFVRDLFPVPNLAAHALNSLLLTVWPAPVVDRIVAAISVIAFASSARFLLMRASPQSGSRLSFLALALAFGWFLHGGQYSFLLGAACTFLHVALFSDRTRQPGRQALVAETVLVVLAYFCHLVAFAVILVVKLVETASDMVRTPRPSLRVVIRRSLAVVPAAVLAAAYLTQRSPGGATRDPLRKLAIDAATLRNVATAFSTRREIVAIAPLVLCVGGLALLGLRHLGSLARPSHRACTLTWTALSLVVLYWAAPSNVAGGGFLSSRLLVMLIVFAAAAVATTGSPIVTSTIAALSLTSIVTLTVIRQDEYAAFDRDVAELLETADWVDSDDVVLTLMLCAESSPSCTSTTATAIRPLAHASGLIAAQTNAADLSLYEAHFPYFPLRFSERTSANALLTERAADIYETPPPVSLRQYEQRSDVKIDVVVLWGVETMALSDRHNARIEALFKELDAGYRKVFTSSDNHATVFHRLADG